ncbi:MAG: copper homeostasis protein CutC [Flavobacteriaceae bacterium]|nr:copper homeostasis protein CutC [Flavobacteriaceae bacterium]
MILEICANSFESAMAAQKGGAHRIELCAELQVGGLTPSFGLLEKVLSEITIPVYALIRPRSGNFTYSKTEVDIMLKDIKQCKKMGVKGIVSGALTSENDIDIEVTKQLLTASEGMDFTFHRAFDWCRNPIDALKILENLGIKRVLTSGQKPTAFEGLELLKELKSLSTTIKIMPGGGINVENVMAFKEAGFTEIHSSASQKIQTLPFSPKVSMQSSLEEGIISHSSEEKIREILFKIA